MTLGSVGALINIVGLMFVFAKSFGELAIPAIHLMALFLYIPFVTLTIGIAGWLFWRRWD